MKTKLRLLRGEIFATVFLWCHTLSAGILFTYNKKQYKVIEVMHLATDEVLSNNDDSFIPELIVVEIPSL